MTRPVDPSSRSTVTTSRPARARRMAPSVSPVHQARSRSVPGPNARSHSRTSSSWASCVWSWGKPPASHRSVGAQRYWPLIHVPRGRPRMMRPSIASRISRRVATLIGADPPAPLTDGDPFTQAGDLGAQLGRGDRFVVSPQRVHVAASTVSSQGSGSRGDAAVAQQRQQARPLPRRDGAAGRRVDDRGELRRHHEQRAAHADQAYQRALAGTGPAPASPGSGHGCAHGSAGTPTPDRWRGTRSATGPPRSGRSPGLTGPVDDAGPAWRGAGRS